MLNTMQLCAVKQVDGFGHVWCNFHLHIKVRWTILCNSARLTITVNVIGHWGIIGTFLIVDVLGTPTIIGIGLTDNFTVAYFSHLFRRSIESLYSHWWVRGCLMDTILHRR